LIYGIGNIGLLGTGVVTDIPESNELIVNIVKQKYIIAKKILIIAFAIKKCPHTVNALFIKLGLIIFV